MSAPAELGPLLHSFIADAGDQRSVALVRLGSAVLALCGVTFLLLSRVPLPVFLVALLGGLMALVWLGKAARAHKLSREAGSYRLEVYREGLRLLEAQHVTTLRFADVDAIAVDEERLDIVVKRKDGSPLRLEPRYPGVEIHQLVHTLQSAAQAGAHHVRTTTDREL